MDGLQARLDRAITEARERVLNARSDHFEPTLEQSAAIDQGRAGSRDVDRWISERTARALDHYAALVALRARYEEHDAATHHCGDCSKARLRWLDAEAERLLSGEAG